LALLDLERGKHGISTITLRQLALGLVGIFQQ
jgi:hypothetical protein